mmetsp:Transcript_3793/g.7933  ORF Transcript_3793/g.7933 Transcript_3793/m.7933 type:complete len:516 (-) Transcript_3793:731-2278(-)
MCMHPAAASSKMTRQTLPWVPLIVSLFACFGDAVVAIMLYPMLPYMVQDFGIPRDQVGFYVGMLGTCYNLLQVPASAFWGKMSDIFGRKRVLMTGQLTLMTATACLGLSSSFGAALAARCLAGALNGNNAVTRAALRDITLPSQRAKAFSLFGLMLSVAFGIAPLFGSFLARPIDAFPSLKGTFLEEYPYLLPCIVADAMVLAGLVGLCWFPADPASYVARFTQHTVEPLVLEDGSESRQNSGGDGGGDAGGGDDGGDGDGDGDGGNINAAEHRRRCRTQPSLRAPLLDGSSPACTHSQSSCAGADARVSAEAPSAVAIRMPPSDATDAAQAPGTSTHNAHDTHKDTHKDTHTPHTTNSAHTTNAERAGQALDAPSAAASCTILSPSSTADAGSGDLKQSGTDATAAIAVRRHGFFFLCVGNGFFGVLVAGGAELFPLFAAADSPGLDISPSQLGLSLTPAAAGLIAGTTEDRERCTNFRDAISRVQTFEKTSRVCELSRCDLTRPKFPEDISRM